MNTDGQDHGYAEQSIGWNLDKRFTLAERDKRVILATKFIPSRGMSHLLLVSLLLDLSVRFQKDRHPYRYPDVILEALEGSLERTQMPAVDIYQLEHASRSVTIMPDSTPSLSLSHSLSIVSGLDSRPLRMALLDVTNRARSRPLEHVT